MYLAVKKFRYFVEGRKFAIFTDHKPLTFVFNKVSDKWSPRQQRHLCFLSEFTTVIRYVPGPDNVVADALSRAPPQESGTVAIMEDGVVTEVIDYAAMARQQATDTGVQRLVAESNLQIARCKLPGVDEQLIRRYVHRKAPAIAPCFLDMHTFRYQSRFGTRWSQSYVQTNL